MKKYVLILAGLLLTSPHQCFSFIGQITLEGKKAEICRAAQGIDLATCMFSPISTTFFPTLLILDSETQISIEDHLPELEAEINAGPEGYYYLRALAKEVSLNPKYNGDTERALNDLIAEIKALGKVQRSSATQKNQ